MEVFIKRIEAPELKGFARNGNVASQAMVYKWNVVVNGRTMATERRLKDAKDAASYYSKSVTVER